MPIDFGQVLKDYGAWLFIGILLILSLLILLIFHRKMTESHFKFQSEKMGISLETTAFSVAVLSYIIIAACLIWVFTSSEFQKIKEDKQAFDRLNSQYLELVKEFHSMQFRVGLECRDEQSGKRVTFSVSDGLKLSRVNIGSGKEEEIGKPFIDPLGKIWIDLDGVKQDESFQVKVIRNNEIWISKELHFFRPNTELSLAKN